MKIKRISSHYKTNKGKMSFLENHFFEVVKYKNTVSEKIFEFYNNPNNLGDNGYHFTLAPFRKIIKSSHLSAWEQQKITANILEHYVEMLDRHKKSNNQFIIKDNRRIKTSLTTLVSYLRFVPLKEIESKTFNFKKKDAFSLEMKEILDSIYNNHKLHFRLIRTINQIQRSTVKKIHKINYVRGGYIKNPVFNKNSAKLKPTLHSYVGIRETSNENEHKYWFNFKVNKETICFPLAYNKNYHNELNGFHLDKESYVSLSSKGRLNIGLAVDYEEATFDEDGIKLGLDLNVRDNFIVSYDKENDIIKEYDYNRTYINEFIEELHKIDKLSKTERKLKSNKKRLQKLVRKNEWYFKKLISSILKDFKSKGITDIYMEDIELKSMSSSFVKSNEFKIKYSRLIRLLRLGNIKNWFREQGERKDVKIRVHFINPAYTSQECSKCHYINKLNRNRDVFKCKKCNHTEHSDYNSSKNILERGIQDVLVSKLLKLDDFNRTNTLKIHHKKVKTILDEFYNVGYHYSVAVKKSSHPSRIES